MSGGEPPAWRMYFPAADTCLNVSTNTSRIDAVEVARAAVRSSNRPKLSKCDQRAPNTPHAKSVKIG
eukprot:6412994-Prymnesium_polylepis.1